jgi:NDP-sugar pyrophosphorylase family protein
LIPPVAILAGGLGTRLGDLCRDRPKPLVEVASRPFIHHQLGLLARNGIRRVVILAGYLGEMIEESVGDGSAFGLDVSYSFDWPDLLGTGGALAKALDLLGERFMVVYGDSWLDVDYRAVARTFAERDLPALMTVYRNENRFDASNAVYHDGLVTVYDKANRQSRMRHIDYGLGCLSASVLAGRTGAFDLAEVYRDLAAAGRLAGLEIPNRFYEIGSPSGLAELEALLGGPPVA